MYEFLQKLGLYLNPFRAESHLPCYINRATVVDAINTYPKIRKYIEFAKIKKEYRIGVLLFSVTEQDKHYKKWLHVAEKDGYQVVEGPSIHGNYKCWAIFVQNDQLKVMDYR